MKVYELLNEGLENISRDKAHTIFDELIEEALEGIKTNIIKTKSIDEIIKLKNLHNQLSTLKIRSYSIGKSLNMDIDEFLKPYLKN